jgi:hypothetical protein
MQFLKSNFKTVILVALILGAALSRMLPHPLNFTPIAAIALFGGAYFNNRFIAILVTLSAMLLSDLFIGFHSSMIYVYGAFALITLLGFSLNGKVSVLNVGVKSLLSSVIFFVITNFGVWNGSGMYSLNLNGFTECYVMAIPFFGNTILGDLFYCTVLFGGFELAKRTFPSLALTA